MGGVIAQQFAVDYSDRVRALVLCDTGARIGTVASWEERIALVRQREWRPRRNVDGALV